jgi:hypothetical protein
MLGFLKRMLTNSRKLKQKAEDLEKLEMEIRLSLIEELRDPATSKCRRSLIRRALAKVEALDQRLLDDLTTPKNGTPKNVCPDA